MKMNARAWTYVTGVFALTVALIGWSARLLETPLPYERALLFVLLCIAATLAQLFKVEVPPRQTYFVATIPFFAALLLLPPLLFVLVVAIAHLVEWIKEYWIKSSLLREWYLQPFNMAAHIVPGLSAWAILQSTGVRNFESAAWETMFVVALAAGAYVLVNHLLVGIALILARNVSFKDSGILNLENLVTEFINLLLGYVVAALWRFNPWLVLPALAPLGLIYRSLSVPSLRQEARTDSKTGLWNARHFNELFRNELERARRYNRPLAFVMADLDLLRNINNTYGHLAGDAALATVGQAIREMIREYDVAGRYGGEEFAILLPETNVEEACAFAERLRQYIESLAIPITTSDRSLRLTMSFGVACFPEDAPLAADLVHAADVAVYQAKLRGRNRVVASSSLPRSIAFGTAAHDPHLATAEYHAADLPLSEARAAQTPYQARPPIPEHATDGAQWTSTSTSTRVPVVPQSRDARFVAFVVGVIGLGILVFLFRLGITGWPPPPIIFPLIAAAVVAQIFSVRGHDDRSVPVAVAITFAAALLADVPGVALVSLAIVLTNQAVAFANGYRDGGKWFSRAGAWAALWHNAFEWSARVLAGAVPALAGKVPALDLAIPNVPVHLVPTVVSALAYYAIESGLVAAETALSRSASVARTWRRKFQWLAGHYVGLCVMGLLLAAAWRDYGVISLLVFALPVAMMVYAQRQVMDRAMSGVHEVQRTNAELLDANRTVLETSKRVALMNEELFLTLAKVIDARDPGAAGHAFRVARYAAAIAQRLQLSGERVESLRQAAFTHDIGTLAIPEHILQKPARLTSEEYSVIKRHAALGGEFLETSEALRPLAPFARCHHERWDGTGYPDGLSGEQIPLEARILAVCDAVEAMASNRPYHRALSASQILAELRRCSGAQFDPQVVEAFVEIADREGDAWIVNAVPEAAHRDGNSQVPPGRFSGDPAGLRPAP